MDYLEIAGYVVGIIGVVAGTFWGLRYNQVINLMKQLGEAFEKTADVLADKKLTKEEAVECLKEWYDVYNAVLVLMGKKV